MKRWLWLVITSLSVSFSSLGLASSNQFESIESFEQVNWNRQFAIQKSINYLNVLADFYYYVQDRGHDRITAETRYLYYTVHDYIYTPLRNGMDRASVQRNLRYVHDDVQRVWDEITRSSPGHIIVERFRATNQNEKIALMNSLR